MFGTLLANIESLNEAEHVRYRELYCGICHSLKTRYGQVSRICVNYDMVLVALVRESLFERGESSSTERCILHPTKKHPYSSGKEVDYAADMSVLFAYHKCLDDYNDDGRKMAKAYLKALSETYERVKEAYPAQCEMAEYELSAIRCIEKELLNQFAQSGDARGEGVLAKSGDACAEGSQALFDDPDGEGQRVKSENAEQNEPLAQSDDAYRDILMVKSDEVAKRFGAILARVFCEDAGHWEPELAKFGAEIGRFIYFMDAALDREEDDKSGSFNPFNLCKYADEEIELLLKSILGQAIDVLERLPLEKDLNLIRSVVYAGVWQRLRAQYQERNKKGNK